MPVLDCELEWLHCTKCRLSETRTHMVLGRGDPKAKLYFCGTAPAELEDSIGEPFVGESGELLDGLFEAVNLNREDVFINNTVGCRSLMFDENGKDKNRDPLPDEMDACYDRLIESIYTVDPLLIVALGKAAFQCLTKDKAPIGKSRGNIHELRIQPGVLVEEVTYPVLATHHPAFLLRRPEEKNKPNGIWAKTIQDILLATEIVDELRLKYYGISKPDRRNL